MRTNNSIRNALMGAIASFVNIFISFIAQKIFIEILGVEYLGINGLFTNIISFLCISELGIGEAIIFNMYKPIAENDEEKIKSLMLFYKKAYRYIILIILILGLLLTPFIGYFVGETNLEINIYYVYLLFLCQTIVSYFLTYKRSILYASQKNYVINLIHILYIIFLNLFQISILFLTKNYFLYLILKIILVLFENLAINFYVNKNYSYLKDKNINKLSKDSTKDIFSRIKAMLFHKIGSFVINGTDNILISKFFGVASVGLCSNYYMITNAATSLFSQIISATTPSIGNLLVTNNDEKIFTVFRRIRFLNFYIATFTGICMMLIIQPFIELWLGKDYVLPSLIVFAIIFNYFQKMMRKCYDSFMIAAGICVENKYVPLVEAILNILFSIIFAKTFGLIGIFLGTIVSGLTLWCFSYPKFLYKKILKRSYYNYAKETIGYIFTFLIVLFVSYFLISFINVNVLLIEVFIRLAIGMVISNLILIIIFSKSSNFKYFCDLFKKKIFKK